MKLFDRKYTELKIKILMSTDYLDLMDLRIEVIKWYLDGRIDLMKKYRKKILMLLIERESRIYKPKIQP